MGQYACALTLFKSIQDEGLTTYDEIETLEKQAKAFHQSTSDTAALPMRVITTQPTFASIIDKNIFTVI